MPWMCEPTLLKNRSEWLRERRNRIGGSDAAAVLGRNPYKTNVELWEEKTGLREPEDISDKPYVQYGNDAEPLIRELFKLDNPQLTVYYVPFNMWTNPAFPFAHASLDGWIETETGKLGILEIKTTSVMSSRQKETWSGRIPDNYYVQILHYFMVTGFDFAVLRALLKYDYNGCTSTVIRDYRIDRFEVEEDIAVLTEKEREFWAAVQKKRRPGLILPEI